MKVTSLMSTTSRNASLELPHGFVCAAGAIDGAGGLLIVALGIYGLCWLLFGMALCPAPAQRPQG